HWRARLPCPPLIPYTTLFRSQHALGELRARRVELQIGELPRRDRPQHGSIAVAEAELGAHASACIGGRGDAGAHRAVPAGRLERSAEHTSELQSRVDLVCRLL